MRGMIVEYLLNRGFQLRTLEMLSDDNLGRLADDYGFDVLKDM